MKTIKFTLMMIMVLSISISSAATLGINSVRENTRFLTDKMAYELRLNRNQIDDVYEVNYDFVTNVQYLMDDVVRGNRDAINDYYDYLDARNEDLRWILSDSQYRKFMTIEYFSKPLCTYDDRWSFRVFNVYTNLTHFFFARPRHYYSYNGGHYRGLFGNVSYYKNHAPSRYGHKNFYDKPFSVRPNHYGKPGIMAPGRPNMPNVNMPSHRPNDPMMKPSNRPNNGPANRPNNPNMGSSNNRPSDPMMKPSNRPNSNVTGPSTSRPESKPSLGNSNDRPSERPSVNKEPSKGSKDSFKNGDRYGSNRNDNRVSNSSRRDNNNNSRSSSSNASRSSSNSNDNNGAGRARIR